MSDTLQLIKWRLEIKGVEQVLSGSCNMAERFRRGELDAHLDALGLTSKFAEEFPMTSPSYYGWFIDSPLSERQSSLLGAFVRGIAELSSDSRDWGHAPFIAALDLAVTANLQMFVELTPPGHVDFGVATVFHHCPRCKAPTLNGRSRWQKLELDANTECPVCGNVYDPQLTYKRTREYRFRTVDCMSCNSSIPIEDFVDEDKDRIDHYLQYRYFEAELRAIDCVQASLARHNIAENDDYSARLKGVADGENLTPQDLKVMALLKTHSFSPSGRREFVSERLRSLRPYSDKSVVFCPACNGCLF